mmetsp:Transcript_31272/g.52140  ORF Transcript_31272/g.52140 Transcript_31272/m.52140 type:complete len:96 (-) Transcript_31272:383-670(-)
MSAFVSVAGFCVTRDALPSTHVFFIPAGGVVPVESSRGRVDALEDGFGDLWRGIVSRQVQVALGRDDCVFHSAATARGQQEKQPTAPRGGGRTQP